MAAFTNFSVREGEFTTNVYTLTTSNTYEYYASRHLAYSKFSTRLYRTTTSKCVPVLGARSEQYAYFAWKALHKAGIVRI